ncbi:membrane-spanning 4-domains subfamily A member 13 isoform X2 [Octodon degus]|uniref:Membrane-spanning 4-domains subfamily A member 13 isoform X2 n=1 Tax=Octodon degus TaxID=10160 RepID=A0A6P6DRT6_OCTDE|nr:membrane-spanning 4-domains subfamily A member 13 isoform X2 [Octodon degus]
MACGSAHISKADSLALGFITSGVCIVKTAKNPTRTLIMSSLGLDLLCIIVSLAALILTIVELSSFRSVSYKNYGQAKLGREVSRLLVIVYLLEMAIALTHSIYMCGSMSRRHGTVSTPVTEEAETTF